MNILVTGSDGFIGRNMVRALQQRGHDVVTFEWGQELPPVESFDWVVHLGAISSTTERDVNKVMTQNYDFSIALYEMCKQHCVNFQFASSASVYGFGDNFCETAPVDPKTPYAWSKYLVERYVEQHPMIGAQTQLFRYFNVYSTSPDDEAHKGTQASPFYQFRQQAETLGYVTVFEHSDQFRRDFISVNDVVDTQIKFFDVDQSGVFNVGSGIAISFLDVANQFNVEIRTVAMPTQLVHSYQRYTCADMTKTNAALLGNKNGR